MESMETALCGSSKHHRWRKKESSSHTQSIFDTLTDTGNNYDTAIEKLDEYFAPKKNVDFEIFKFRTATQNTGETIDQYTTTNTQLDSE